MIGFSGYNGKARITVHIGQTAVKGRYVIISGYERMELTCLYSL